MLITTNHPHLTQTFHRTPCKHPTPTTYPLETSNQQHKQNQPNPIDSIPNSLTLLFLRLLEFKRKVKIKRHLLNSFRNTLWVGGDDGEESLGFADGSTFLKLNPITDLELVIRVMGLILLLPLVPALVFWVEGQPGHLDCDCLVVGGADDPALHRFHGFDDGKPGGRSGCACAWRGEREGGEFAGEVGEV